MFIARVFRQDVACARLRYLRAERPPEQGVQMPSPWILSIGPQSIALTPRTGMLTEIEVPAFSQ